MKTPGTSFISRTFGYVIAAIVAVTCLSSLVTEARADSECPMVKPNRRYKVGIDSAPQGATVYLDRKECGAVGVTPWTGTLATGDYTIIIELNGYQTASKPFKVARVHKSQDVFVPLIKQMDPPRIDISAAADKNVYDADVKLDGQYQGKVPLLITTVVGRHLIEFKKEGFEPFQQWVEVKENEKVSVTPVFKEVVKQKFGSIIVDADVPGAEVYLDGNKHPDVTPTIINNVIEGVHIIEVRQSPAVPWKQTIQVVADQQAKVHADLKSSVAGAAGTIRVLSNVATAHVFLDGVDRGAVPLDINDAKPGEHIVEVKNDGYVTRLEKVTVNAGSSAALKLDLDPAAVKSTDGTIKVVSPVAGANVIIDGAAIGKVPQEKKVAPGDHFVGVQLDGYKTFEQKVHVDVGQVVPVSVELKAVGRIRVIATPIGAKVSINNVPVPDPLNAESDVGTNVVRVEFPGYDAVERTVSVEGGKTETISVQLEQSAQSGEQMATEQRGLSSFGARALPRGRSTIDMGIGYPYIADVRVNVGVGSTNGFTFDAGVEARTLLSITELGLGGRMTLFDREPISFGVFGNFFYGTALVDKSDRNDFTFDGGAIVSLTALSHVTISGRAYVDIWSDRHCPALTSGAFDGTPIQACVDYQNFLANGANANFTAADAKRLESLTGDSGTAFFGRDNGIRVLEQLSVELALQQHWNAWFIIEGAPGFKERALFTDPFNAPMLKTDYETYIRLGVTYKF